MITVRMNALCVIDVVCKLPLYNILGEVLSEDYEVDLSFNSVTSTLCFDVIDDDTAAVSSKKSFFLVLSPTEDMNLYIDSRQSILSTSVLILNGSKSIRLIILYN